MDISTFTQAFLNQLDPIPSEETVDYGPITEDTQFRIFTGWDSMAALSIITMVDDDYGVTLTGLDIKSSNTISDIFKIVKSKK